MCAPQQADPPLLAQPGGADSPLVPTPPSGAPAPRMRPPAPILTNLTPSHGSGRCAPVLAIVPWLPIRQKCVASDFPPRTHCSLPASMCSTNQKLFVYPSHVSARCAPVHIQPLIELWYHYCVTGARKCIVRFALRMLQDSAGCCCQRQVLKGFWFGVVRAAQLRRLPGRRGVPGQRGQRRQPRQVCAPAHAGLLPCRQRPHQGAACEHDLLVPTSMITNHADGFTVQSSGQTILLVQVVYKLGIALESGSCMRN